MKAAIAKMCLVAATAAALVLGSAEMALAAPLQAQHTTTSAPVASITVPAGALRGHITVIGDHGSSELIAKSHVVGTVNESPAAVENAIATGAGSLTIASPNGVFCTGDSCGWKFTHAQTVALHAAGTAAATALCQSVLNPIGLGWVCSPLVAWLASVAAPGASQCLYAGVDIFANPVLAYVEC